MAANVTVIRYSVTGSFYMEAVAVFTETGA